MLYAWLAAWIVIGYWKQSDSEYYAAPICEYKPWNSDRLN